MAVEPGHSLPWTQLPFPNWKSILLTPLKTHCRSKASHQSPRPRHRMTLNPQCLFTEKEISCSSERAAVHSWASEHRVRQGKRYTSILQNPWEVLLGSLSWLFTKTTQKFCFLHTDWKDKLLWKKTVFEIYFLFQSNGLFDVERFALLCSQEASYLTYTLLNLVKHAPTYTQPFISHRFWPPNSSGNCSPSP